MPSVSVDGLRKQIAASFNRLVRLRLNQSNNEGGLDIEEAEALNELRQHLAFLMIIHSSDPNDLMSELDPDELLIEV